MVLDTMFWKVTCATCRGMWLGVVWALMAGSGVAAELQLWDGDEGSVNVLSDGAYSISAATNSEYVLTTNGKPIPASVTVSVWKPAVVTLRLRQLDLAPKGNVLKIVGTGTVHVVSEKGVSKLRNMSANGGDAIKGSFTGNLVFLGDEDTPLWIFAQGSTSTVGRAIYTPEGSVCIGRGKLRLLGAGAAGGGTNKTAWVSPAIEAKQVTFKGGETSVGFFVTTSTFAIGDMKDGWSSVVSAKMLAFEKGKLLLDIAGEPTPFSGELSSASHSTYLNETVSPIYRYPEEAFEEIQAVAQGGQVGGKAFLRFDARGEALPEEMVAKHIVSGTTTTSPAADAVKVFTERGVVAVDVAKCPEPKFAFADEGMAGAVELFGCVPTVTADAVRVDYAFGLSWIGPVRVEDEEVLRVAIRAAVRLPQETAQSKTFRLMVSRSLDNGEKVQVFEGKVPFVRRSETYTLYETASVLTSDNFSGACGTYRYRVTAMAAE